MISFKFGKPYKFYSRLKLINLSKKTKKLDKPRLIAI